MLTRRFSLFVLASALLLTTSATASAGGFSNFGRRFDHTTSLSPQRTPMHGTQASTAAPRPQRELSASSGRSPRLSTIERSTANARGTLSRMTSAPHATATTTQTAAKNGGVPHIPAQNAAHTTRPAIRSAQPSRGNFASLGQGSLEPSARKRGTYSKRLPTL